MMDSPQKDDNSSSIDEVASPGRHRKSKIPLIKQKQLVLDIKARGGIAHFCIDDYVKDNKTEFGARGTPYCDAIVNKINDCKRKPSTYERLQLDLLGKVIDNSLLETQKQPPFSASKAKKQKISDSNNIDIATLFKKMDFSNDYFGTVTFHETVQVNLDSGYRNLGFTAWETPSVVVGTKETISTSVITIKLNDIDPRWLDDIEGFIPFALTQVDHDALVLEFPFETYDFYFGPRLNEYNCFGDQDIETAYIVSTNTQEQIAYEMQRNQIINEPDRNTNWRTKIRLQFKGKRLDFTLINENERKGVIPMQFVFGPNPSIKWRIAVVPEEKDKVTIRRAPKQTSSVAQQYKEHMKQRAALLAKAKAGALKQEDMFGMSV